MPYDLISVGLNAVDVLVRLPESVRHDDKKFVDAEAGHGTARSGSVGHQPAFVVKPVETTGCGGAHHAGFIVGLLEGWPLELRMEFGSLLASRVAGSVGGRIALPWRKEAPDLIRTDISESLKHKLSTLS